MTLAELRQVAARQQHQIVAQQQLLVAKEQRLKFLKQQEARHHSGGEHHLLDPACVQGLREKIEGQEMKLRQLRALRGQVEQQKTNNDNLGTELSSIRALFSEKEKELNLAVSKVEELTRQLDEIRSNKTRNNGLASPALSEIENLRRELLYRTKLSEQQNSYICKQREDIALRQQDISVLDQKISDLGQRLHRKRLLNEQLASQIHNAALARNANGPPNRGPPYNPANVVAVEPLVRDNGETLEHSQDDLVAKFRKCDLGEFTPSKNDPKYQTLPYNTKFTLKNKTSDESSAEDDSWPNSMESASSMKKMPPLSVVKPSTVVAQQPVGREHTTEGMGEAGKLASASKNVPKPSPNSRINTEIPIIVPHQRLDSKITPKPPPYTEASKSSIQKISSKPVVPPKPALPVKPMIASRHAMFVPKEKEPTTVNAALSVLQKKSNRTDKTSVRYPPKREPLPAEPPKSKLATYFQKTLVDGPPLEPLPGPDPLYSKVKKPALGLPIKPKPLTIRKTPGLEPPRLKVQPLVSTNFISGIGRKSPEKNPYGRQGEDETSNVPSQKPSKPLFPAPDRPTKQPVEDNGVMMEVAPHKSGVAPPPKQQEKEEQPVAESESADQGTEKGGTVVDEPDGVSALRRALRKGNLKGVGDRGGRTRRVSFDPLALLLDAALEGELELVKKTAAEVPNPSASNDEGITALHNAICAGHTDVVAFLVEFGCDVNAQDSDGWTPLHCAASCNNLSLVRFLVERGACIFATTLSDHETAAEKCEEDEEGFESCSQYLYTLQDELGVRDGGRVYAVYDYEAAHTDELGFRDGDGLVVLRRGDDDEADWWWARRADDEGYVPRNLLGLFPRVTSKKESDSDKSTD